LLSSSLFIGFGSFVNFSRAAILGLLAVTAFNLSKNIKKIAVFSAFVGILMLPLLLLTTDVIDAFMSSEAVKQRTDTETMEARWRLFNNVIDVITNNPLVGIGYDNYVKMYGGATHNSYLQVLVELGILGFAMYLMFIWKLVVTDILKARMLRNMDYYRTMLGIAFVTLFIPNTIVLMHSPHFLTILMISISGIMAYEHSEKNTYDRPEKNIDTLSKEDYQKFPSVKLKK